MDTPRDGINARRDGASEHRTPTHLGAWKTLARRLFSCPRCGRQWVTFDADEVNVVGVEPGSLTDPRSVALRCISCQAAVDREGRIVQF